MIEDGGRLGLSAGTGKWQRSDRTSPARFALKGVTTGGGEARSVSRYSMMPRQIRALADGILVLINGIVRIRVDSPDPISLGNVRRYREDGAKDAWVFPGPGGLAFGTPPDRPRPGGSLASTEGA